jgi:FkbM family methyltransferase
MRDAIIQAVQRFLKRSYNKQIVEVQDPFRAMQRLLAGQRIRGIVDGGGYQGEIAVRFAQMFPEATVYTFEPSHQSYRTLTETVRSMPNIKPVMVGLSDERRTAILYVNAQDSTNALSPVGEGGKKYQSWQTANLRNEEVQLVTLDEWATENSVFEIDLIKLDLQGHELRAITGGAKTLSSSVKLVYTEVEFIRLYEENCLMFEVEAYLRSLGFELFQLYNLASGEDNQLICADAIFVKRSSVC